MGSAAHTDTLAQRRAQQALDDASRHWPVCRFSRSRASGTKKERASRRVSIGLVTTHNHSVYAPPAYSPSLRACLDEHDVELLCLAFSLLDRHLSAQERHATGIVSTTQYNAMTMTREPRWKTQELVIQSNNSRKLKLIPLHFRRENPWKN